MADLVVGVDFSGGMLLEAREMSSLVAVTDAEHLPFVTGGLDTTLCMHMRSYLAETSAPSILVNANDGRMSSSGCRLGQ